MDSSIDPGFGVYPIFSARLCSIRLGHFCGGNGEEGEENPAEEGGELRLHKGGVMKYDGLSKL